MSLSQRLDLKQGQSLVMTPQLQQAIKLLQMSNFELQAFVQAELERNPLLEKDENADGPPNNREERDVATSEASSTDVADKDVTTAMSENGPADEKIATLDTDFDNVYADEARADQANREALGPVDSGWQNGRNSGGGRVFGEDFAFDATLSREQTMQESLTDQLNLAVHDPIKRIIGAHLIGMINETGYLSGDINDISKNIGAKTDDILAVLTIIQTFEPAGIGARDLRECLTIQLREHNRFDPAMAALIENLDLLAKRDFSALKRICQVDIDDIRDMVAEIRNLNPRPGNKFGSEVVQPVVPDVYVRPAPDGTWLVELNSETLPRVLVNNQYYANIQRGAKRETDKVYLSDCMSTATWLIKSLDQRARTILAVSREIVRQQDSFLVKGVHALKPLNLRNIADAISMHESTISRVTSNKYIATPRGTFELKYFFTTAISSSEGGDAHSAESVRHQIKSMIDEEAVEVILSDDKIVDILSKTGVDIARRTVAKYRESLGIPSSVQRRREKRAGL